MDTTPLRIGLLLVASGCATSLPRGLEPEPSQLVLVRIGKGATCLRANEAVRCPSNDRAAARALLTNRPRLAKVSLAHGEEAYVAIDMPSSLRKVKLEVLGHARYRLEQVGPDGRRRALRRGTIRNAAGSGPAPLRVFGPFPEVEEGTHFELTLWAARPGAMADLAALELLERAPVHRPAPVSSEDRLATARP